MPTHSHAATLNPSVAPAGTHIYIYKGKIQTTNIYTIAMNIGDTVRFLNDIGGGKISAFKPGGIVIVEHEDSRCPCLPTRL